MKTVVWVTEDLSFSSGLNPAHAAIRTPGAHQQSFGRWCCGSIMEVEWQEGPLGEQMFSGKWGNSLVTWERLA